MFAEPCKRFLARFLNCRFCFFISTSQGISKLLQYIIYIGTCLGRILLYCGKQFLTLALSESAVCPHVIGSTFQDTFASGACDSLANDTELW